MNEKLIFQSNRAHHDLLSSDKRVHVKGKQLKLTRERSYLWSLVGVLRRRSKVAGLRDKVSQVLHG
jgi:hypothetical protein